MGCSKIVRLPRCWLGRSTAISSWHSSSDLTTPLTTRPRLCLLDLSKEGLFKESTEWIMHLSILDVLGYSKNMLWKASALNGALTIWFQRNRVLVSRMSWESATSTKTWIPSILETILKTRRRRVMASKWSILVRASDWCLMALNLRIRRIPSGPGLTLRQQQVTDCRRHL